MLHGKYDLPESDADALAAFLTPMLDFSPSRRATAAEMLTRPWLDAQAPAAPTDAVDVGDADGAGDADEEEDSDAGGESGGTGRTHAGVVYPEGVEPSRRGGGGSKEPVEEEVIVAYYYY